MRSKKTELVLIYNIVDIMVMYEKLLCKSCVCTDKQQLLCLKHWYVLARECVVHGVKMS
jgi:hypothetical protein